MCYVIRRGVPQVNHLGQDYERYVIGLLSAATSAQVLISGAASATASFANNSLAPRSGGNMASNPSGISFRVSVLYRQASNIVLDDKVCGVYNICHYCRSHSHLFPFGWHIVSAVVRSLSLSVSLSV